MAHFAHITNGIVDSVIVIEQATLDDAGGWYCPECGAHKPKEEWVQTSYNMKEGVHKLGGIPMRKNYAGRGYSYDAIIDAFIPPKQSEDFVLDVEKGKWKAPKEMPLDGKDYEWSDTVHDFVQTSAKTIEVAKEII